MELQSPQILNNQDVLLRTMEFLGPRHACIGIGSTCKELHQLSKCDSLWKVFWKARCLFPKQAEDVGWDKSSSSSSSSRHDGRSCSSTIYDDNDNDVHKAAFVFRHAIHEMDLGDRILTTLPSSASCMPQKSVNQQSNKQNHKEEVNIEQSKSSKSSAEAKDDNDDVNGNPPLLHSAYVQKHSAMKHTNLRVEPFGHLLKNDALEQSNLRSPLCSQTWPGQLSLVATADYIQGGSNNNNNMMNNRITCLNSAESWCDHPTCNQARCGPQGCLRSYRFSPRDYSLSATGVLSRECSSQRDYDMISFVRCSWCSVSFCSVHVDGYYCKRKNAADGGGKQGSTTGRDWASSSSSSSSSSDSRVGRSWYHCDECQLSSCPDCVSQVFLSPPDMDGCGVVTAGKTCRRTVCSKCTWYVGEKKGSRSVAVERNIPGGDYGGRGESEIVAVKGAGLVDWEEVETSCSKCLRHIEFRWRELAQVQDAFGGFMP